MPTFKIVNEDQMHDYTHVVRAIDRETAIKQFKAGHYGTVISCEEIKEETELSKFKEQLKAKIQVRLDALEAKKEKANTLIQVVPILEYQAIYDSVIKMIDEP